MFRIQTRNRPPDTGRCRVAVLMLTGDSVSSNCALSLCLWRSLLWCDVTMGDTMTHFAWVAIGGCQWWAALRIQYKAPRRGGDIISCTQQNTDSMKGDLLRVFTHRVFFFALTRRERGGEIKKKKKKTEPKEMRRRRWWGQWWVLRRASLACKSYLNFSLA